MANKAQMQLGQHAGREVNPLRSMPNRSMMKWYTLPLIGASMLVAFVPVIGAGFSHVIDRVKNRWDANHELKLRAKYYAEQVGTTLGMDPRSVGKNDLLQAATMNPALRRVVQEVENKRNGENNLSMGINAGVGVASVFGAGGIVKGAAEVANGARLLNGGVQAVKVTAGALTGGAVAGALSKHEVNAQELLEATEMDIARSRAEGLNARAAVNPQITFMIRMAQDEVLSKQINGEAKKRFGKAFHQLESQQMGLIMNQHPELANATLREAHAIANGDMNIRDLAATAPNLGGGFAGAMARDDNARGGFVDRLEAQRAAAAGQQSGVIA